MANAQTDTTRIVNYTDKIIIKANLDTRTDTFFYQNRDESSRLELLPNNEYRLFLSLDYEFIGVSVGFVPDFLGGNTDESLKGKSDFTDYSFRFFLGKWVQGLQYSKVSGYYVRNTGDFAPGWTEGVDPYLQFNGMTNTFYGMKTSYVFNPNFSYRNIVYQTEWQKVSSGSLVGTLKYDYSIMRLREDDIDNKERFFTVALAPTYYYTLVLNKNWFLSGNLSPSIGARFSSYKSFMNNVSETERNTYLIKNLSAGANLGFSSKRVIFGLNLAASANWYNNDTSSHTENDQFYGVVYVGYRFDSPKPIKKLFEPVSSKSNK